MLPKTPSSRQSGIVQPFASKRHGWVAMYKEMAWPLQQKDLGRCLGWFTTVEGELNTDAYLGL